MTQEINKSAVPPVKQQFASACAAYDGTIWGINLQGALLVARSIVNPTDGNRQITWQALASERPWQQVAVRPSDGPEEELWCLGKDGTVYRVMVLNGATVATRVGGRTLAFLDVGADGSVWALDAGGNAFIYDMKLTTWVAQSQPRPFTRLSVRDVTHVMALDSDGNAYALGEKGSWQNIGSGFLDISVPSQGYAFAIGKNGNLLVQLDDGWFDCGGQGLKTISAASLSNIVVIDTDGNLGDLTEGRPLTLGTGRTQTTRFDTEDPFNEKKSTHLWLVNRGALLATGEAGYRFRQLFQPDENQTTPGGSVFHQAVCQGIYDADFVDFFNGPAISSQPTYESHFYDPDTGLNWRDHAKPTALTRGRELFNSAIAAYRAGRLDLAGYALGVSLHFLTDLGQPMHAVNFTNISFPVLLHSKFETAVLELQEQCPMPPMDTPYDGLITTIPDDFFIELARKSKNLWNTKFSNFAPHYRLAVLFTEDPYPGVVEDTKPILQGMLTSVMAAVAAYVTEWMTIAVDRNYQAHPPICVGQQGLYWSSILWVANREGALQYYYTDYNQYRETLPPKLESWFSGPISADAPKAPTQLAACMTAQYQSGSGMVFAVTDDGLYYISQLPQVVGGPPDKDVSGWTPWTQFQNAPNFSLICACPYTYDIAQTITTGASVWGVADGQLKFSYQHSKTDGKGFDPFNQDEIVWSDWQVSQSAPPNMTCLTASGATNHKGFIFGLADGILYATSQIDPRTGGGWTDWAKLEIPNAPAKLKLVCALRAYDGVRGSRVQLWGVDDQGILRSATLNSTDDVWSAWSGEWNANAPRNIVAMAAAAMMVGSEFMRLWAFAEGKLHAIWEQPDATTHQRVWSDWTAVPHFDGPPLPVKVSLPIGPLQLKIDGHDISSLEMLIKEDPDHPALDPTSALRNVRVAFGESPDDGSIPGKMNLLRGTFSAIDVNGNHVVTYEGSFDDNSHGFGTVTDRGITNHWTASGLTMRSTPPAILSVTPEDQVAAGFGQLLLIRGVDLPDIVVISQDGSEQPPQWTSSATPTEALVRLPLDLHPGPATVRLTNADKTISTPDFPIFISATPGTPIITAVTIHPAMTPVTKVAPGQKIAITVESMDTQGADIRWFHPSLPMLTSASELTTAGVGGSYCVVTTVPSVTPNDNWTLSVRLSVGNALSAAATWPLQT